MWSSVILLFFVGIAFANVQQGWQNGKEYTYKVRSRTLASYNLESNQYTGVVVEANLIIQPNGQDTLIARISQPRFSQIHTHLENGWDSTIPQNQINLQTYPLNSKAFEIKITNGVVTDLIVEKTVPTWEINVIKSIASQLQVDTLGENAVKSKYNQLPEENQPSAVFTVVEDSVGGKCEVLYDISVLPNNVLQSNPEFAPMPEILEGGEFISVVKTKNYTNCDRTVGYQYGFNGRNPWEPGSNDDAKYLARSHVSRTIISGNLRKYTIQSSIGTNKVIINPDQKENNRGMVVSKMNLTLNQIKDISEPMSVSSNTESTGNLVYNYDNLSGSEISRRPSKVNYYNSKSEDKKHYEGSDATGDSSDSTYDNNDNSYLQSNSKLTEAPQYSMLPYFIGDHGKLFQTNNNIDIVKVVNSIAQQISSEMELPNSMTKEQTLEKYTILYKLIRTMSAEQIAESQRSLYEPDASSNQLNPDSPNQKTRRNTWIVFRDAVAQAGTGPALVNIKQWIKNKQVDDHEAAVVVDTLSKFIEIPTSEYMDAFFDLVTMSETKIDNALHDSAIHSFSNIIRRALVNKKSSHNYSPVHAFGKSRSKSIRNIHKKYIPHLIEELQEVIRKRENPKVQTYISALGKIAHPRILSVFEPYLEGRKNVSPYQRLYMVLSLYTLTSVYPGVARSVLYRIYANTGEHHEIRTAAVYLLMRAKPSLSMLQRMADYTNYDSSKHVNSAVKSIIESLAQLENTEVSYISNAAKIALPLLTSETYGPQYSRAFLFDYLNPETHSGFSLESYYIGSDDSIIPKVVNIGVYPTFKGLKGPRVFLGGAVSSVQNLWNLIEQKLFNKYENYTNRTQQEQKYTAKNIAKILNIVAQEPEQVEGFFYLDNKRGSNFYTFDNHSIEYLSKQIKQWYGDLSTGKNVKGSKFSNYELTLSFPMESGYPFLLTLEIPQLVSINGNFKSNTAFMKGSSIPQSTSISGKVNFLYGMKMQKRFGFVSSFQNQEYIAGIDRIMQFYLPFKSELSYDVNEQEAHMKLQPSTDELNFNMLYYSTKPFTAKHDILNWQPVTNDKNTHIIYKDRTTSSKFEISGQGNKQRLAFQWEKPTSYASGKYEKSNNKYEEAMEAGSKLASSIATLYYPNNHGNSEYESYLINISPDSNMSAELRVSYEYSESRKNNKDQDTFNSSPMMKLPYLIKNLKASQRRQELLKDVSKNINSAQANAIDIDFRINGNNQSLITFTAAQGNSNFDEKSRVLLYASANLNGSHNYVSAGFKGKTPNVNTLDYEQTLKANNEQKYEIEIHYGDENMESHEDRSRKIKVHGAVKQSEELKNKIRQSQNALLCNEDKKSQGNKMTSTCQKVNRQAKSVNTGYVTVAFDGESPLNDVTKSALDYVDNVSSKYTTKHKDRNNKSGKNEMKFDFEISANNYAIDVIIQTDEGNTQYNVPLGNFYNKYYDFDESSSNIQKSYAKMTQRGVCHLDKTEAETFDNHRYPLQLDKCWYVVMTSYPKNDPNMSRQRLDIPENMNVIIMAKENENKHKEAQVTLGETEIRFFTSQSSKVHVSVDGAEIKFSNRESYIVSVNGKTIAEVVAQPDNTVILISDKYNIRFTYDTYYAQIEAGERYRNSVRGLCGNFDGRSENDQLTPKGCQLKNPTEFAATYALINEEQCEASARQIAEKAFAAKCYYESIQPGDVISERDAGRENQQNDEPNSGENKHCTHHRTKVLRAENEICFSVRPLPVCSSHCRPAGTIDKRIPFHCVANTNAAEKVAERVENGINPNLGSKLVSRFEDYQIPIYCKV